MKMVAFLSIPTYCHRQGDVNDGRGVKELGRLGSQVAPVRQVLPVPVTYKLTEVPGSSGKTGTPSTCNKQVHLGASQVLGYQEAPVR